MDFEVATGKEQLAVDNLDPATLAQAIWAAEQVLSAPILNVHLDWVPVRRIAQTSTPSNY